MEHHHNHSHSHGRSHSHAPASFGTAFAIGTALNLALVVAQFAFGYLSNSLALISDGVHNLGDVIGLLLAWGASWAGQQPPTARHTYGYRRASILAALANAALLLVATGAIVIEAVQRFAESQPVDSNTMILVAGIGIFVNAATALMFMRGRANDLNLASVFAHMAGDAVLSVGVVITAFVIGITQLVWLDPLMSIVLAAFIFLGSWRLMRDAVNMALDAVPPNVDPAAVHSYLASLPGGDQRARPPYLGHEHDRNRTDRSPRSS